MQTRASQAPGNEAFTLAKRQLSANFTSARQKWSISSCHPDPRYHGLCHFPTAALLLPCALFTLHCAATTHVLPHSRTMWQIHKSVYVSECWKRAQILLAARPTLLLSSVRPAMFLSPTDMNPPQTLSAVAMGHRPACLPLVA